MPPQFLRLFCSMENQQEPGRFAADVAPAVGLVGLEHQRVRYFGSTFAMGPMAGRSLFGRGDAIALIYGVAPRNLSIALAIAMNAFGQQGAETARVIALAYVAQIQASAWCNKFVDHCSGAREPVEVPALARDGV